MLARLRQILLRSPLAVSLVVGFVVCAVVLGFRYAQHLEPLELGVYDAYMRYRPAADFESSPVVVIGISENDIQALGTWPLDDQTLARTIEALAAYRPRTIGIDIYRDISVPPGGERLDVVFAENPNVIAVYKFQTGTDIGVSAPPSLEGTQRIGFNDIIVDAGGIVRRGLLFLDAERTGADGASEWVTGYALPLQLALLYLRAEGIAPAPDPQNPDHIRLGETTIAPLEADDGPYVNMDARGYQYLLDYAGHASASARYTLTELLGGELDGEQLAGKVVLVGSTAESVPDFFYTPFSPALTADHQIPGVILHAIAADQLIRLAMGNARPMAYFSEWGESLWTLVWSLVGALLALRIRSPWRAVLVAVVGVLILVAVTFLLFDNRWWLPVVPPLFAWLVSATMVTVYVANREARQRRLLMHLFSRHVDPRLAASIWEQRDRFLEGGRPSSTRLTATIMFVDLHGFTEIGERLAPEDLMDWLNDCMGAMTPLVMRHGGVVLRFIGDAIMAAFGVPLARESEAEIQEDARNAVRCALAMERKVLALNRSNVGGKQPMIGMRIGICTGPMVGGSMGDEQRLEYNVHGDSVNTAARLEAFEKQKFVPEYCSRPCRILIGAATRKYLDGSFSTEAVGDVALRGKQEKLVVYQVFGPGQGTSGRTGE